MADEQDGQNVHRSEPVTPKQSEDAQKEGVPVSTQEQESTLETSNFNNENLQVVVTKYPNCQIKFEITVQPQAVEAAYAKATKNVKKEVSLPGFRKGKVPDRLIMEKFESAIQKEWVDLTLQTAFNEAIHLTNLHPLREGNIKRPIVHECSREKGANFTIEFEVRPQIPDIRFEDLKIRQAVLAPITEKDRERALHQVANQFTTYEPAPEDTTVQENEFADLDIEVFENGVPRKIIENQRTQINEEGLPKWVFNKVIGLKKGESAEGETEQDPVQHVPDFKPTAFRVTVNAIYKGETPPLDDALAQRVGLKTLDELKTKISEKLDKETHERISDIEMNELEQVLLNQYSFDLPRSLIDKNKRSRLNDYINQLKKDNQEGYLQSNRKEIEQSVENATIHQLQLFFILRKVAADHQIDVTQEDISQELTHQISLIPSGRSFLDYNDKEHMRDQLYVVALDRKVKQFLLDKATRVKG